MSRSGTPDSFNLVLWVILSFLSLLMLIPAKSLLAFFIIEANTKVVFGSQKSTKKLLRKMISNEFVFGFGYLMKNLKEYQIEIK